MIPDQKQLEVVSKMLGVKFVTIKPMTPLHCIVKVTLTPWAWLAGGYLHLRAYKAAKKAVNDDFSLVEVW